MIADVIAGALVVTMLTVFVRPGSKGSAFIEAFTAATVAVISQVTDIANGTDAADDAGSDDNQN